MIPVSGSASVTEGAGGTPAETLNCAVDAPLGLAREADLPLRAWRGRSGRRYVVSVYPLSPHTEEDYASALLLAVARDKSGQRRLIAACESSSLGVSGFNGRWLTLMRQKGANELHVHLLAATRDARRATLADLGPV